MKQHAGVKRLSFGWLCCISVIALFSLAASAAPDFAGMTDLQVLMHEDKAAGLAEFKRRARDYSPAKIREIEQEYHKLLMTPRPRTEPVAAEILQRINLTNDALKQAALFKTLHSRYQAANPGERAELQSEFLRAWSQVSYPSEYDSTEIDSVLRFREYAFQASLYFDKEAELIPHLVERCLNSAAYDRYSLFVSSLLNARVPLGEIATDWAETIYQEKIANREGYFLDCNLATLRSQLLRILGRSGEPGYDALLRLGREDSEEGYWSLGINTTPEAEVLLWELYGQKRADQDETRLKILRAIASKGGTAEERAAREQRIRTELAPYLKLPEGKVNIWNIQSAVELARDTRDPFYLPLVNALETAFFELDPAAYHVPGMEGRMDQALEKLQGHFNEAKLRLTQAANAAADAG